MADHISDDARALLTAAYAFYVERNDPQTFRPGTALDMAAAANRVGMITGTPPYNRAIEELEDAQAIEENPITRHAVGGPYYVVAERGMELLGLDRD
jgi:hypothetical protein